MIGFAERRARFNIALDGNVEESLRYKRGLTNVMPAYILMVELHFCCFSRWISIAIAF